MRVPTVLLLHTIGEDHHYDWMIGDPNDPTGRLWTARIALPSDQWAAAGNCDLIPLPPHRRNYLTYQGPLTGDRGDVRRVDQGEAIYREWMEDRMVLEVVMERYAGIVEIVKPPAGEWQAKFLQER